MILCCLFLLNNTGALTRVCTRERKMKKKSGAELLTLLMHMFTLTHRKCARKNVCPSRDRPVKFTEKVAHARTHVQHLGNDNDTDH